MVDVEQTLKEIETQARDEEKKIPYPKASLFVCGILFCEEFCYIGIMSVLSIYLNEYLFFSISDSTVIYHTVEMLTYIFCLFGALVADGYLGKYKTVVYMYMICIIGNVVLSSAVIKPFGLPSREFSIVGLFIIAVGAGGVKGGILPLGGDQFILPQQEKVLTQYFFIASFMISLGELIATLTSPLLRRDFYCFGENGCYILVFGVPTILLIVTIIALILGKPLIRMIPPEGSLLCKVFACICYSIKMSLRTSTQKSTHWLNHSKQKYGEKLVDDIKRCSNLLLLLLPLPVFWALVKQTGSKWIFQAQNMNGDIGFYTILPDQMQFASRLFFLLWIPIYDYFLNPAFHKMNILRTAFQKITCGGVIMSIAFIFSGCVSLSIEAAKPILPTAGSGEIVIYNTLACDADITSNLTSSGQIFIASGDYYKNANVQLSGNKTFPYYLKSSCANFPGKFEVYESSTVGYYFDGFEMKPFEDGASQYLMEVSQVRTLVNFGNQTYNITYRNNNGIEMLVLNSSDYSLHSVSPGVYWITINNCEYEYKFYAGSVYTILIIPNSETSFNVFMIEIIHPNVVHMLWTIPQHMLLTLGEVMFGLITSAVIYFEAPVSMKSILVSSFLCTNAIGNLIVIVVEEASIFEHASHDFFFYAGLMLVATLSFALIAKYKYKEIPKPREDRE